MTTTWPVPSPNAGTRRDRVATVRYRLAQAWAHLTAPATPVAVPPHLASLINDGVRNVFRALPSADQAHSVAVAIRLADDGWDDHVVTAGLLHDIGKAATGIRMSLLDRGAWVMLRQAWPAGATRLATRPVQPRIGAGIWCLARHAETGASVLATAGYSQRVCWLVRHHEHPDTSDPGLRALIAADDACDPRATTAP